MTKSFEELDYQMTPIGPLSLRKRKILPLDGIEVFEVKLGEEYLMSSLFHSVEVALSDLGLAELSGDALDIVVGGLGLGYTAAAALKNPKVRSLLVVDALEAVIGWHKRSLVPLGEELTKDPRCRLIHADFFACARDPSHGFDPETPGRRFHAVLLDIDHSPQKLLHPSNASFYEIDGLKKLAEQLHPGGVFAMWSDDPPDAEFMRVLGQVFGNCRSEVVTFHNPLQNRAAASTVYIARNTAE